MDMFVRKILFALIVILFGNLSGIICEETQFPANYEQPFATIFLTALINGKASLPCDITPSTVADQVVLILWYKDDQLAPIFTVDARRGNLDNGRVLSSPSLEGRAYFNTHSRPAHLQIDPVRSEDEGDYRCRVDFKKARTVNTVIQLTVIVPPQTPKILDSDNNILNGLVGPFNEGQELSLKCLTRSGKPRPSLIWSKDYVIIDDSFEFDNREVTTNQLTISSLSRNYLLSTLMCQAINNNITTPSSVSITVDMNLKPTEVRITQLTPILVANSEALFECNSFGSRPKPSIHWIFDGKRIDTRARGEHQTSTTVRITVERQHRGAILECTVENTLIANSAISDHIKLDVHYPPELHLTLGTASMSFESIQEGIDIYFDCQIDANPRPTVPIVWIFNGKPIHPQKGILEVNQSLVLQRVNRKQMGTYQCQSSNRLGTVLSNAQTLEIQFAPVCKHINTLVYGIALHEAVLIDCEVEANPSQVSFQWKLNSYTNLQTFSQFNDSSSVLTFTPRTNQEYGTVECTAKNSIGIQRNSCKYLLIQYSEPVFPFTCRVVNQSESTLTVNCVGFETNIGFNATNINGYKNSDNNSVNKKFSQNTDLLYAYPPTYYICEVYKASDERQSIIDITIDAIKHRIISANSSFEFFIDNLPTNTRLNLKIYSKTHKMKSSAELEIRTETLIASENLIELSESQYNNEINYRMTGLSAKNLMIGLLIFGGIVVLIVILVAIIAVFRVRYWSSSIRLTTDNNEDHNQDLPPVETMVSNDCEDECSSDETLLKCGSNSSNNNSSVEQKPETRVGAPDIIPVPYFVNAINHNNYNTDDNQIINYKSSCSGVNNFDEKINQNYFNDYKKEDLYTKSGRVYVYNKEENKSNQLTDFQNVLHVNLIPNGSKQSANVSL